MLIEKWPGLWEPIWSGKNIQQELKNVQKRSTYYSRNFPECKFNFKLYQQKNHKSKKILKNL